MLLQFGKAADHERVFEVGCDHLLEQLHVVRAELAEALVHVAAELAVALAAIVDDFLNVGVALVQVLDNFVEVACK